MDMISYQSDQQAAINFSQTLLRDWMLQNTLEGMTIINSCWVFARFENLTLQFPFGSHKVDLFKMFNAGAIPTLYYCLLKVQPDDMTESYHWVTQARLDWVKTRIASHLGPQAAAYIESLN